MDLGGVRQKMARKNCECINAVKKVTGYGFKNVGTPYDNGFFPMVRKLYIDAYCKLLESAVCQTLPAWDELPNNDMVLKCQYIYPCTHKVLSSPENICDRI